MCGGQGVSLPGKGIINGRSSGWEGRPYINPLLVYLNWRLLATLSITSLWLHSELCCVINFCFYDSCLSSIFPTVGAVHYCFPEGVH